MASDRKTLLERAKLAESAEKYDDMAIAMKEIVVSGQGLTKEERKLFKSAFTKAIGARKFLFVVAYSEKNEKGIIMRIEHVLQLLDKYLIKPIPEDIKDGPEKDKLAEDFVDYLEMKGDYNESAVEVTTGDKRMEFITKAENAYKEGYDTALKYLAPTDPIRLRVSLSYAWFLYHTRQETKAAVQFAKKAFYEAVEEAGSTKEDHLKESAGLMKHMHIVYTQWASTIDSEENK